MLIIYLDDWTWIEADKKCPDIARSLSIKITKYLQNDWIKPPNLHLPSECAFSSQNLFIVRNSPSSNLGLKYYLQLHSVRWHDVMPYYGF